jgi:RimJ/RimL family protein N-acetyltransferase
MQDHSHYNVRPLELADIPNVVSYWANASSADLEAMGADQLKLPTSVQIESDLKKILATPESEKRTAYMIWLVDGVSVGFSSLKNIVFGESGEMHLHMWNRPFRGKGHGSTLFCLAALEFYRRFHLKRIKCEPRAANPMPNKMLQKVGFPLVRTHIAASSELSLVCELNEYNIRRETAALYLSH